LTKSLNFGPTIGSCHNCPDRNGDDFKQRIVTAPLHAWIIHIIEAIILALRPKLRLSLLFHFNSTSACFEAIALPRFTTQVA
jgi:hypothetical protein